ncbi:MAG: type II toxin-antitoxin system HicB family antitoxin [Gemmataceae bacterium]|nr:type II toxin-antitoxin system HicB family antitoxin [Gemmataceae bacterium]
MFTTETEQENNGRWIAEVCDRPVVYCGATRAEAIERVQALALRVVADRLEHGEPVPQRTGVFASWP